MPDSLPSSLHQKLRPWWVVALAVVVFSGFFWSAGSRASVTIDGTRYHYLDDDQMISMRYARNLAEGHGPVWNRGGERVEGYTNFGWMMVMAAVHRLGAPDATAALWVRAVNWGMGVAVLLLAAQLLRALDVGVVPAAAALAALAMSFDLLFWAVNGFETTLLTALFLWTILRALRDGARGQLTAATCLLAGMLPIVRVDAVDLTAAAVATAVILGARLRWVAVLAAWPLALHEIFRLAYYSDWLPNTYYLKVAGRSGLFLSGLSNLKAFAVAYTVVLILAACAFLMTTDRRVRVLSCLIGLGFVRLLFVGPDMFPGFRFLAPYLPVLLAAAAAGVAALASRGRALTWTLASLLVLTTVCNAGVGDSSGVLGLTSVNGGPFVNTVSGVLLARHARHDSSVVVAAAGCIGYFSRLEAIDLLGKSDRHVARVTPAGRGGTGHNRFDVEWSLRSRPDFVATFASHAVVSQAGLRLSLAGSGRDYGSALLQNPTFVREYGDAPVRVPFLLEHNALFVHAASTERFRLGAWHAPVLERP